MRGYEYEIKLIIGIFTSVCAMVCRHLGAKSLPKPKLWKPLVYC